MLKHKLEIYVPSTVNVDEIIDNTEQVKMILRRLAEHFGGSSAQTIQGCWIAENGEPVFESPVICFAYCTEEQLEQGKYLLKAIAEYLKKSMAQEAIAVVVDGVMDFI